MSNKLNVRWIYWTLFVILIIVFGLLFSNVMLSQTKCNVAKQTSVSPTSPPTSPPSPVLFEGTMAMTFEDHVKGSVLQILLMTKDEWPMLRSWVLYHGSRFGFKNLYILDGSTDQNAIRFLRKVNRTLGVNVKFTDANLNQLTYEMNTWAQSFKKVNDGSRHFIIKLDTDELIGYFDPISKVFSSNKALIIEHLNALYYNGSRYGIEICC